MGYSKSMTAVNRVDFILRQLVASEGEVTFESKQSDKLAYYIREGIKVARNRVEDGSTNEELKAFANLKAKYEIKADVGRVRCVPRAINPIDALRQSLGQMTFIEPFTKPLEVIGVCIQHRGKEMLFPNTILSEDDLKLVYNWTSKNGYHIIKGAVLTITKNESEAAWIPS